MKTETLLLNYFMGESNPWEIVDWAGERMVDGLDTPNLRILAGLNPRFEFDEIEPYFIKTCKELNIELPSHDTEPREISGLVYRVYELEEISAEMAIRRMAKLYVKSEYSDPILYVWYWIEEELSLIQDGYSDYYPSKALDSLEVLFEHEWALFLRALKLNPG